MGMVCINLNGVVWLCFNVSMVFGDGEIIVVFGSGEMGIIMFLVIVVISIDLIIISVLLVL